MKYVLIPALLLISFAARAAEISRVVIVDYGIYTADTKSTKRDANGVRHSILGNIRHAETTRNVPAQLGVHFGFRYRVDGKPAGTRVTLTKLVIYPPAGVRPPKSVQRLHRFRGSSTPTIGKTSYTDYSFDDPWELVPGPWTFEFWDGKRKLVTQTFNVVKR